ncbi:MAG TPA: 30S ribosomal protein S6 [Candidatus Limnocylindria bacterium]|jgi:small subunit ribosomal protein S6|nr:30S ribosomal protein S6 [Candidatus Limnocylindria bacterium]
MRRYELMLLFRPDLEDDKLQSAVEKVTRAIVNAGGTLTKVSPWGKRRMAYDIQHFREASYFLLHFDIAPAAIRDLERGMLISEEILRHLVTVLVDHGSAMSEEDIPPAAVPADDSERQPAPAQEPMTADAEAPAPADAGAEAEVEADAEADTTEAVAADAADEAESDDSGQTEEAETAVEA